MSGDFTYEDFKEYNYGRETFYEYDLDEDTDIQLVQHYYGSESPYNTRGKGWYIRINIEGETEGHQYIIDDNYDPYWFETPEDAIDELNHIWDKLDYNGQAFFC